MVTHSTTNVTELLYEWQHGDPNALEKLTPLVWDELRRIAHSFMQREGHPHTLETGALINEAYLRLAGPQNIEWQDRGHFFAVIAQVMRHILVDHARRRHSVKHGGEGRQIPLDEASLMSQQRAAELVALDEALDQLATLDPRKSRVVELRYFAGLSLAETAEALDVSLMTVRREWRAAKAWIYQRVMRDEG